MADADVYCFQEEERSSTPQIVGLIADASDTDAADWSVRRSSGGCVIVSRLPMRAVPDYNDRYEAGIVGVPGVGDVILANVHLKCCGYVGSSEDARRSRQLEDVSRSIEAAREVVGDSAAYLVVGDWNLVGGRDPLTKVEERLDGVRTMPRHIGGSDVYTWYSPESRFWPGQLDLVMVSSRMEERVRTLIIDSRTMTEGQLAAAGLFREDSAVSDHLLVVADIVRDDTTGAED